MKKLKMCSGKITNIEKVELIGTINDGYDLWYLDSDSGEIYHNLLFENDLPEAKELMRIVQKLEDNCNEEGIHISLSKKV